jgi:hypothetical protein
MDFVTFLSGFVAVALAVFLWMRIARRRRISKLKPELERLLDVMIRTAESARKTLGRFVVYNVKHAETERILYHLQLLGDALPDGTSMTYDLKVETAKQGKNAGLVQVKFAAYFGTTYQCGLAYPDFLSLTKPEPWLMDRLKSIRDLVGEPTILDPRPKGSVSTPQIDPYEIPSPEPLKGSP